MNMLRLFLAFLLATAGLTGRAAHAEDWAAIEQAARKEGTVVLYHNFSPSGMAAIIELFNKSYPGITVKEVRLPSGAFYARFEAEYAAGASEADYCSSVWDEKMTEWQQKGWFAKWDPPEAKHLPPSALLGDGLWEMQTTREMIIYNKTKVKASAAPKDWPDLFDPVWKGKIGMNPPWRSLGPQSVIAFITKQFGINDMAERMKAQQVRFFNGSAGVVQAVIRGDVSVAILTDLPLNMVMADDPPLGQVYPKSGIPSSPFAMFVPATAKHPNAGKVFGNWVLTEAGQLAVQEQSGTPGVRVGLAAPKYVPANSQLNLVPARTLLNPENEKSIVQHWQDVFEVK